MNRAFLIVLVPAAIAAAAYLGVMARLGVRPSLGRFFGAGAIFLAAVFIVSRYRRRKARPPGS